MTSPGEIEHVPTKVVPYFVTGYDDVETLEDDATTDPEPPADEPESLSRSETPGLIALGLAVVTIIVHVIAVVVASGGGFVSATVLAWVAIALSCATVLAGLVAVIGRFGRGVGIAAIVIGLIANPFLLLSVLNFVGGQR